jgi:hypothetical protein
MSQLASAFLFRIPNSFKNIILITVVKNGNESEWFRLFEKAQGSASFTERLNILKALSRTRDYNLLKLYFSLFKINTLI